MIRDVAQLVDGAVVHGEVGVVGAGFAGVELARLLGRSSVRVVLLESGRLSFDPRTQELARFDSVGKPIREVDPDGPFTPYLPPVFRGETRIRQFGGTSNVWTGKWRMFDPLDFEKRPWVPHSGWPISFEDLRPFYDAVGGDYGPADIRPFRPDEVFHRMRDLAAGAGLQVSGHVWQAETLRLAQAYGPELRDAPNVDVVLGANAVELVLADDHERLRAIAFSALDGHRFELEADHFVLTNGGLEAPRLLLASNRQVPAGVGNERDLVGRFFMDHPKHKRGTLRPGPAMRDPIAALTATQPRPRPHVSFSLSDDVQREQCLLNHAIYFKPKYRYDLDYPTEGLQAARDALRARSLPRLVPAAVALARSPDALRKVARRRYGGPGGPLDHYELTMYAEQAPNPDSRVRIGAERDALGVPKLVVDWRLTPLDHSSFGRTLDALREAFARTDLGRLDFGPEPLGLGDTVDAAHHIGATRMAATPSEGVVDADLRVFGTTNLFIASSSVFPTGHSAGPTFTIIALARRLGAHLLELRTRRRPIEVTP